MGLLDDLGKMAASVGASGAQAPGGGQGALVQALAGMLGGGGLEGLVQSFQQKGLGDVVGSWVSTGANLPVSADQVTKALGPEQLGQLARQVGLEPSAVAGHLTQLLPGLVDKLTPEGKLPDAGTLPGALSGLLKGIF